MAWCLRRQIAFIGGNGWGLNLADIYIPMGNLLALAGRQIDPWPCAIAIFQPGSMVT